MGALLCCCKGESEQNEEFSESPVISNASTEISNDLHNIHFVQRNLRPPSQTVSQRQPYILAVSSSYATTPKNNIAGRPKINKKRTYDQANSSIISSSSTFPVLTKRKYNPHYFPITIRSIIHTIPQIYRVFRIHESKAKYWEIKRRITNRYFRVHCIEKIENDLLENSYLLKKKQKLEYHPNLEEKELFHGTKWKNADSICKNNFNWRFSGKEVGHKFGRGVCFSCNAMYAANYSDKDEDEKVMFIAKVMIGKKCEGKYNMTLPPAGCDTSTKQNDYIVVVKYEDNEYYPLYRIKFHIDPGYVPLNKRKTVNI